jgi:tetratricopeptide (TPR) repeat protein
MFDPDVDRGTLLESEGKFAEAEGAYRVADERGDAEGAFYLGGLLKRRGDVASAEDAYRRAEERGDPRASCNLAVLLEECGDVAGAEAAYRRADAQGFPGGAYGLGQILYARGDVEGSIVANRRADELGDSDASFNLGVLLQQRGDLSGAEDAFQRADLRGNAAGAAAFGRLLEQRGEVSGAEAAYRRADERGDANGAFGLGALLLNQNQRATGIAAFHRSAALGHAGASDAIRLIEEETTSAASPQSSYSETRVATHSEGDEDWRIDTALAEIDVLRDALIGERGSLARVWAAQSDPVALAEEWIRALDVAVSHRSIALRDFQQRHPDFNYTPPSARFTSEVVVRRNNGRFSVPPEIDSAFDRDIGAATQSLLEASRKSLKGRLRASASDHLDRYSNRLAALTDARAQAQRELEEANRDRKSAAAAARAEAQSNVDRAVEVARTARRRLPCGLRPWTDEIWRADWKERSSVLGSTPLYLGSLQPTSDPRLGDNADFGLGVSVPLNLHGDSNFHLIHEAIDRPIAHGLVRSLLLRSLLTMNAGRMQLVLFDPVGLGQSVASLLDLGEYDPSLIGGKVWSSPTDLLAQLGEQTSYIELVVQKYLRSTYSSIDEFNREAGEVAEPYRIFVAFDFPSGFNDEASRELVRIIQNGPRCGVRTILVNNSAIETPYGVDIDAIVTQAPPLVLGRRFSHEARKFSADFTFEPDSDLAAGPTLLGEIVEDVGRRVAARTEPLILFDDVFKLFAEAASRSLLPGLLSEAVNIDPTRNATWWQGSTMQMITAPIGRKGAREVAALTFDSGDHTGALLVGRPGSGKSTLLHSFIAGATTLYGPDELELYLIDFKEGVEFEVYAKEGLPHARCVAIESDREFGLSVLESLEAELKRRGELLRGSGGHHSGLEEFRRATNEIIPRVLLVFDEFHVLFSRNDKVGLAAADLLEQLIRQGRSFGIHVLLASQSLAGLDALGSHVPQLLPVRILLPATESDARRVLGESNVAGQYLTSHGEGILNLSGGAVEANQRFKGALIDESLRTTRVALMRRAADARGFKRRPIVFEGNAAAPIESFTPRQFREEVAATGSSPLRIRIGAPMTISGTADIHLGREGGSNVLLVARDNTESATVSLLGAQSLPKSMLVVTAASLSASMATVDVVDFTSVDDGVDTAMGPLLENERIRVHRRRGFGPLLQSLLAEVRSRVAAEDADGEAKVLMLYGLHRARDFDTSAALEADPELLDVYEETVGALGRRLPGTVVREFTWRIAGRQSADDSQTFVGNDGASQLRDSQVLLANDDRGIVKRCTTFTMPTEKWLRELLGRSNG